MKRDPDKTAAAAFKDKRSFVRPDGRYMVFGKDMEVLRQAAFERSEGRCENIIHSLPGHALRCCRLVYWETGELHHDPPRSKARNDTLEGVLFVCSGCHALLDRRQVRWSKKEKDSA